MLYRSLTVFFCLTLAVAGGRAAEAPQVNSAGQAAELAFPIKAQVAQDSPQRLTDEERQQLSQRAEEPGPEIAGGALTTQQLTYIVIALAAAVLVLVLK